MGENIFLAGELRPMKRGAETTKNGLLVSKRPNTTNKIIWLNSLRPLVPLRPLLLKRMYIRAK